MVTGIQFFRLFDFVQLLCFLLISLCFFLCDLQSRSTWYPLALSQSHASHGEKLKTDQPLYQPDSNHYDFLHPAEGNQSQICNSNPLLGQFSQSITANPVRWKILNIKN